MARFKENLCHESFIEGFLQYSLHFQERGNILRPSWFNRVVRGLRLIGPIDSVAARNTWNDIYDEDEIDEVYEDRDIDQQHPHWDYWDLRSQYPLCICEAIETSSTSQSRWQRTCLLYKCLGSCILRRS